ncbi:MAG: class I SAM-dependent methyltransferase [archaeon]|nr:MAG: class I SAM-dependent methyltransferase [archaeon]
MDKKFSVQALLIGVARQDIEVYYRKHDDFGRYLMSNRRRVKELSELYRANRKYFGRKVLDLACGGGILGFIIEKDGHGYVGIDINGDMIESATAFAKKIRSRNRFILGDIISCGVEGSFDSVTLLGNAMCHFDTRDFVRLISRVDPVVGKGSHFITDYRDVAGLLFRRKWKPKLIEKDKGKSVVSRTRDYDSERGDLIVESEWEDGTNRVEFRHAIWAPFILEPIMASNGWELVNRRSLVKWSGWLDVYEKL